MGITRRNVSIALATAGLAIAAASIPPVRRLFHPIVLRLRGAKTIATRMGEFTEARRRLLERFSTAGTTYPPAAVVLVGLKKERLLELWAGPSGERLRLIARFPILGASGDVGPKLREGDRQVPEGVYAIESLNPNSRFHVSLRVAYPNEFDREMAKRDGRTNLGGDIMIHGGSASVGCLAMGDDTAEELFLLAAEAGIGNIRVILSPVDLRTTSLPAELAAGWREEMYASLRAELSMLQNGR